MRRFWRQTSVIEQPGGWGVALDGKPMKTPAKLDFICPARALAEAVAAEWAAVQDKIDAQAMPLTQLCATALDIMPVKRAEIIGQIAAYAETDLLCYRAEQAVDQIASGHYAPERESDRKKHESLAARQAEIWQPYLDWALAQFDAMLKLTTSLRPIQQDEQALGALRRAVEALDDFRLAGLQQAVAVAGSLVLGLALVHGWRDASAIEAAAELDAHEQAARWGADEEITARQISVRNDLAAVERFVRLLG